MKTHIYLHIVRHQPQQSNWKTREIADAFDLTVYQARYYLTRLSQEGKLMRTGSGKGFLARWALRNDPAGSLKDTLCSGLEEPVLSGDTQ